jgi:hypothetical protein
MRCIAPHRVLSPLTFDHLIRRQDFIRISVRLHQCRRTCIRYASKNAYEPIQQVYFEKCNHGGLCRSLRFEVSEWTACQSNCTCGLSCPDDIRTFYQTRSIRSCNLPASDCPLFHSIPEASRLCAAKQCSPCVLPGSKVHGSVCHEPGTARDGSTGLLKCSEAEQGVFACECKPRWSGPRCDEGRRSGDAMGQSLEECSGA